MTSEAQTVVNQVFALPLSTRAEVLTHLIQNLEADDAPTAVDRAAIDSAWAMEIQRRVTEVRENRAELLDGEAAMKELRERFGL